MTKDTDEFAPDGLKAWADSVFKSPDLDATKTTAHRRSALRTAMQDAIAAGHTPKAVSDALMDRCLVNSIQAKMNLHIAFMQLSLQVEHADGI